MTGRIFNVGDVGAGTLSLGPRPHFQSLGAWADDLGAAKITHVVSLIAQTEVERYQLHDEADDLRTRAISFTRFPVDDFDIPEWAAFKKLIADLSSRLENGEHVFLHCAGGVGRAGTTACCLLINHGATAEEAIRRVGVARGTEVPETKAQIDFIRHWSEA